MIPQATLVMVMLLLDTGRCWNSMPMPTCPTTCEDFNLDHSSLVACSYSYNLLKNFLNQSSVDVPDILRDGNFKVASSLASPCYSCSQVNTSMSSGNLSKCLTSSIEHFNKPGFEGLSGYIPVLSNDFHYWPVANITCHEAQKLTPSYGCRATNSECVDLGIGAGYHCICSTGFKGNPYLVDGCHDIDECVVSEPCEGTCTNLIGSYSCSCPPRFEGDGKKDGSGCYPQRRTSRFILGKYLPGQTVLICFVVPAFAVSWIFWRCRQKKMVNLRRSLFSRNGGELLQAKQSIQKTLSILTAEDLKKATNNYDESNVLSQEHHLGITYKGILPGTNSGVTIQLCHAFERCKIEALVTKLVTLSQVSHRNVVRLLGCCLETQIPLLVYEFITCKTLFDHINDGSLSWDVRVRIAADTAGALAYLHSATIIHGALSISCILLDHNYNVKLTGFDLRCLNCSCVELYGDTSIYSDPDLFSSGQLTEKSDVYSFGFILLEMLTREGVMSLEEEEKLAKYILGSSRDDELLEKWRFLMIVL